MSNIDKQDLRDIAEKAISEEGDVWWSERQLSHEDGLALHDTDAKFIAAANPATVLALLDELEAKDTEMEWMRKRIEELAKALEVSKEQRVNWFQMAQKLGEDLDTAEKRIVELEAIKPIGYFAYDTDGGFTNHETAERAQEEAQNAIEYFRENACDGWSDEVDSVCWGAIMQEANKVDERPVTSEDKCASHIEFYCDYALLPGSNSAAGIGKGE
ncbi:TPA: ead/Ea22-like family protein [Citrobacter amalonaticus]